MRQLSHKLINYFNAGYPLLYILTAEEERANLDIIEASTKCKRVLYTWSATTGLGKVNGKEVFPNTTDPIQALIKIRSLGKGVVVVCYDLHHYLKTPVVLRHLRDINREFKQINSILIIVSPVNQIPSDIQRDITLVELDLPDAAQLKVVFDRLLKSNSELLDENKLVLDDTEKDRIIQSATGLTTCEAENAISKALVETIQLKTDNKLVSQRVMEEKALAVKKSGILQYFEASESESDIGGMEVLKDWLRKRTKAFTKAAREFNLPTPKGICLLGTPGCGKSLSARAASNILKVPLIRFDIGRVMGSLVGASEENMRNALQTIDALGACCLTGDTMITMGDGLERRLDKLKVGDIVACYNEATGQSALTKIIRMTSRSAMTTHIFLKSGHRLQATADHQHLILRDGIPIWIKTVDLRIGDLVAIPIKYPVGSISTQGLIPLNARVYLNDWNDPRISRTDVDRPYMPVAAADSIEWESSGSNRISTGRGRYMSLIERFPGTVTSELMYLLGLIDSDGSISKQSSVSFYNADLTLHCEFSRIVESYGIPTSRFISQADSKYQSYLKLPGITATPTLNDIYITKFSCELFRTILRNLQFRLLTMPPELLIMWLAGYVDGDGSICIRIDTTKITFCAEKHNYGILLGKVIQRLGIIPSRWNGKSIEITGQRARDLAIKLLPFVRSHHKATALTNISQAQLTTARRDSAFHVAGLIKTEMVNKGLSTTMFEAATSSQVYRACNKMISEERLVDLQQTLRSSRIDFLLQASVRWVPINSLEYGGVRVVYDPSCAGDNTHNYFANGVITHNCVWLDEMEKAFAGSSGNASSDVIRRVFGTFLEWMQDHKSPAFIIATMNSKHGIPPEMLRKGRWDELFFVGLPNTDERRIIFDIHISKRGRDPKKFDVQALANESEDFSGAEIEYCVSEGLYTAFDKGRELAQDDLLRAIIDTNPLAKSCKDELSEMAAWARENARFASKAAETENVMSKGRKLGKV